jgi:hypothetical protein
MYKAEKKFHLLVRQQKALNVTALVKRNPIRR